MKLIDILEEVKNDIISDNYKKFCDRMLELYPAPDVYNEQEKENHYTWHIQHFISLLSKEPKESEEKMSIKISYVYEDNSDYEWDDDEWFDVSGVKEGDSENSYALEFTKWDEWLAMDVSDESGKNLSKFDMFIHCLWEMTFLGSESDSDKLSEELLESTESFKKGTAKTYPLEEFLEEFEDLEDAD